MRIQQEILLAEVSQNNNNLSVTSQNPHPLVIWSPTISALVAIIALVCQVFSVYLTIKAQRKSIEEQKQAIKEQKQAIKDQRTTINIQTSNLESQKDYKDYLDKTLSFQRNNLKIQEKAIRNASLLEFNKRYDFICFELRKKLDNGEYPIEDYCLRFWTLQQDQYISWIEGFLDDYIYETFMKTRRKEYSEREQKIFINGKDYEYGFNLAKDKLGGETNRFFSFMFRILNEISIDIETIMFQEKKRIEREKERIQKEKEDEYMF